MIDHESDIIILPYCPQKIDDERDERLRRQQSTITVSRAWGTVTCVYRTPKRLFHDFSCSLVTDGSEKDGFVSSCQINHLNTWSIGSR